MAEWKNEDDIKAELRELAAELRRLREELRGMAEPAPKSPATRAFLHRESWPSQDTSALAADRRKTRSRKPKP
jgi:hypothetical protein